jgi:hypothetical protein
MEAPKLGVQVVELVWSNGYFRLHFVSGVLCVHDGNSPTYHMVLSTW